MRVVLLKVWREGEGTTCPTQSIQDVPFLFHYSQAWHFSPPRIQSNPYCRAFQDSVIWTKCKCFGPTFHPTWTVHMQWRFPTQPVRERGNGQALVEAEWEWVTSMASSRWICKCDLQHWIGSACSPWCTLPPTPHAMDGLAQAHWPVLSGPGSLWERPEMRTTTEQTGEPQPSNRRAALPPTWQLHPASLYLDLS